MYVCDSKVIINLLFETPEVVEFKFVYLTETNSDDNIIDNEETSEDFLNAGFPSGITTLLRQSCDLVCESFSENNLQVQ